MRSICKKHQTKSNVILASGAEICACSFGVGIDTRPSRTEASNCSSRTEACVRASLGRVLSSHFPPSSLKFGWGFPKLGHPSMRAQSVFALIAAVLLCSSIYNVVGMVSDDSVIGNNAFATSSSVTFTVNAADTLTVNVSSNNISLPITPDSNGVFSSTDNNSNNLVVSVGTNNETGYTLTMLTSNTNLTRNTAIVDNSNNGGNNNGNGSSTYPTISTLTNATTDTSSSNFELNKWGYQLKSITGTNTTTNLNTTKYLPALPLQTLSTSTSQGDGTATLNFATKLDNTVPSGTYTTTLTFVAIANYIPSTCNPNTICYNGNGADTSIGMGNQSATSGSTTTLWASNFRRDGYGFAGWSTEQLPENQNGTNTFGPNQTVTLTDNLANNAEGLILYARWIPTQGYMQNFTIEQCNALNINDVIALTDSRDNNVYAIAKLPMGWSDDTNTYPNHYTEAKCWMIENLRLANGSTINTGNTNNPLAAFASTGLSATSSSWCTAQNAECYNQSMLNTINTTTTNNYAGATGSGNADNLVVYSYGNYYNWYSATAGNGTYESSNNNTSTTGDICPLNWQLPKGGGIPNTTSSAYGDNSTNSDFYKLGKYLTQDAALSNNQYNQSYYTNLSYTYRAYPNNFVYSGDWSDSQANYRGANGIYWSSTVRNAATAYTLNFSSANIFPGTRSSNKYDGLTARCITSE